MIGLLALAGLIACVVVFIGVGALAATITIRAVNMRTTLGRWSLWATVFVSTVVACWLFPNYDGIRDQLELNRVSGDCGWRQFKRVKGVEGVYSEARSDGPPDEDAATLLEIYPVVEYLRGDGKVVRVSKDRTALEKPIEVTGRTYRFGFKRSRERLGDVVDRFKDTIYDFEANEVLAENVHYTFRESRRDSLGAIMFAFVAFRRSDCGGMYRDTWRDRFRSVLVPKWALEPEQYSAIENEAATEVPLEVLKSEQFKPEKVMSSDEWRQATYDQTRGEGCHQLIRPEFSGSRFFNFVQDSSFQRKALTGAGLSLCDTEHIWLGYYVTAKDASGMVIAKYTLDGQLIYKLKFQKPDMVAGYLGSIPEPSFRHESGYLVFDWVNASQSGAGWKVSRRIRARIVEPARSSNVNIPRP